MQFSYTFCGSTSGLPFSIIQPNKRKGITVFQKQYRHHLNGDHLKGPLFDIRHKDERHFRGFCLAWPWPIVYKNIQLAANCKFKLITNSYPQALFWFNLSKIMPMKNYLWSKTGFYKDLLHLHIWPRNKVQGNYTPFPQKFCLCIHVVWAGG